MHREARGGKWIAVAAFAGAMAFAPATLFAQDITLHGTRTQPRGPEVATTSYFTSAAIRQTTADGNETIIRLDAKKIIALDNKKKTYSEMTFDQLQKMTAAATASMDNLPPEAQAQMKKLMGGAGGDVSVTPMGAGETIAGYATQKYHITMGSIDMEMSVAPSLVLPPVYYDVMKALAPANPMFDMKKMYEEFKKIKGTPLKTVTNMKMMGQSTTTTELVTSVDKGAIPGSVFDVPAGYKQMQMK